MEIKKLGFGLMRLPYSESEEWGHVDLEKTRQMVDAYIAQGFSYFDTAWVYHGGVSEKVFGELVAKRYDREKFQVTSKMPLWGMKKSSELSKTFKQQLKKCQIKYFDYYFLHALNKDVWQTAENLKAFEWMQKMKKKGKILHPGFSFHDNAEVLDQILTAHPEVELVQLQINYMDWESEGVQSRKCYEVACKHGVKVAIMEPVRGGQLVHLMPEAEKIFKDFDAERSMAEWALRFCGNLDNVLVILSGMSNMEQLTENMKTLGEPVVLSDGEKDCFNKAAQIISSSIKIPCTGCGYCLDGCPKKIKIPRFFELVNEAARYSVDSFKWHYNEAKKSGGAPADCIGCKKCESMCPQKLQIVDLLKDVVRTFE